MMGAERERCHWDSVPLYLVCWLRTETCVDGLLVHRFSSRDLTTLVRYVLLAICTSKPNLAIFSSFCLGGPSTLACVVFTNLDVL
jgi:hypothetical protein